MNWLLPWRWPLRRKLLAIILLILIFPVFLVQLLRGIEGELIRAHKDKLLAMAQISALSFNEHADWFNDSIDRLSGQTVGVAFYVFPLNDAPQLDGFFNEWGEYEAYRQPFPGETGVLQVLAGFYEDRLYLSLQLEDDRWRYAAVSNHQKGDWLQLDLYQGGKGEALSLTSLRLEPQAPGLVPVKEIGNAGSKLSLAYQAHLSEVNGGVNLEIKIPAGIKPVGLGIQWWDNDEVVRADPINEDMPKRALSDHSSGQLISTARFDFNPVIWPQIELLEFVKQIELPPGRRLIVLNNQGRVLARAGSIQAVSDQNQNWLIRRLLGTSEYLDDEDSMALKLNSPAIFEALKGEGASRYLIKSGGAIIEASWPIVDSVSHQITGILLLQENTAPVQITRNKVLVDSLFYFAIVFLLLMILMLWYAGRLSRRVIRLTRIVQQSVDDDGRVVKVPKPEQDTKGDEIGELYAGFFEMSRRLAEYNEYLENLASRLSHELRTPVAIVRSSLDNLKLAGHLQSEQEAALQRAIEGNQRLSEMISRMREASSVKSAMKSHRLESRDLVSLLKNMIEGYGYTWQTHGFELKLMPKQLEIPLAVELFVEMMDKVIANAVDFSAPDTPIQIILNKSVFACEIVVFNRGPLIPKKNLRRIFSSMVSVRSGQGSGGNLGLGLYVARLIAEFHGGRIRAENREKEGGVAIIITLPLSVTKSH